MHDDLITPVADDPPDGRNEPDMASARPAGRERPLTARKLRRRSAVPRSVAALFAASLMTSLAASLLDWTAGEVVAWSMTGVVMVVLVGNVLRARVGTSSRPERTVIVGAGDVGQLVARKVLRHPEYGIDLLGFVDAPQERWRRDVANVPMLGPAEQLLPIVRNRQVDRVIIAFSETRDQQMIPRLRSLGDLNVRVDVVPRMFEIIGPTSGLPDVEGLPLVRIAPPHRAWLSRRAKRAIDLVGAVIGLIVTAPVFAVAAWRISRGTAGPVFFRQVRLGENMQAFTMLKFRTMKSDADSALHRAYVERAMDGDGNRTVGADDLYKVDYGDAVTPTGRWLRRTSLDELPQLINVLRGEMSLVGPRPCMGYETEHFAPHHYERFLAPAGITGLWQVTARAHASFAEALEMDVAYVRHWSLRLDLSLLVRTPIEVIRQRRATY